MEIFRTRGWPTSLIVSLGFIGALAWGQLTLLDGLFGSLLALGYGDYTVYAPGYSDSAFRKVQYGMSQSRVREILGEPLWEIWAVPDLSNSVTFRNGSLESIQGTPQVGIQGVMPGVPRSVLASEEVRASEIRFGYSWRSQDRSYRVRVVVLRSGAVIEKVHEFYLD